MDDSLSALKQVVDGLEKRGIRCWLESGTLLAIVREGKPFVNDDYDIGVVADDIPKLIEYVKSLGNLYSIKVYCYEGNIYKMKLIKYGSDIVDIQIYYKMEGWYMSPQKIQEEQIKTLDYKILYRLEKLSPCLLLVLLKCYGAIKGLCKCKENLIYFNIKGRRSINRYYKIFTWRVNAKYVDSLTRLYDLPIPMQYKEYLMERYGNWEVPNKSWDFKKDDVTLVHEDLMKGMMFGRGIKNIILIKIEMKINQWKNKYRIRKYSKAFAACGKNLWIKGRVEINNPNRIHVGDNFRMNKNACIYAREDVIIGDNVTMSGSAKILSGMYDLSTWERDCGKNRHHISKKVFLNDGTWLCVGAMIMPGVSIRGKGVIVASGAVVTKDIEESNVVVAGVPAKIVRRIENE